MYERIAVAVATSAIFSGICEHGLQRSWDKACGGSCFCEHEDRYRTFVFVL